MTATATPQDTPKAAVFLSYSRTDGTFRERLAAALEARGYAPIYDQSERIQDDPDLRLTAQDEWWRSLKAMIAASDVMIFVVTPDSATSPVCDDEIAHARVLGKRVIAILRRAVDFNVAPERLRALNVKIDFRNDADHAFYAALASLCAELDLDIEWHRLGTHLTRQANRWEQSGRPEAQLLRAGAIAEAESWAARRPQSVHELGRTLLDFLDASRAKESADRERLLTVTGLGFIKSAELAVSEGLFDSALRIAAAGVIASEDWLLKRVAERLESTTEAMRRNKLVRILAPNTQRSRHIAFNAQGELLVLGYQNGTLWDSASGIQIGTIESSDEIFSIEVCPIGDLIVTGHRSGLVRVWRRSWDSARPYQVIAELAAHRAPVAQAVFHADGRSIGTASWDGTAGLWVSRSVDRLEWRLSATTTSEDIVLEALSVALHPHEARFVVSKGAHLERWRVEHGRVVCDEGWSIEGHNRKVWHVEYNPDGTHLVTASEDGSARIWDAASGALNHDLKHGAWVRQARYSPNGKHLITCATDGIIRTWDAESGSELNRYNGHASPVIGVAFNRSGSHLASVSEDSRVRLWKCETDGPLWTTPRQPTSLNDACFSPDGSRIAIALGMRAWNETDYLAKIFTPAAPDGVVTCDGHKGVVWRVDFDSTGKLLLTASDDGTARVWCVEDGRELQRFDRGSARVRTAKFVSGSNEIITASEDGIVRKWSRRDGSAMEMFRGDLILSDVDFDESGDLLILSGGGGENTHASENFVLVQPSRCNGKSSSLPHTAKVTRARLDPSRTYICSAAHDNIARVWDARTSQLIREFKGHGTAWPFGKIESAVFSSDGKKVLTAGADGTAIVWYVPDGRQLDVLRGHRGLVSSANFSADGQHIVTASHDRTASIWSARKSNASAHDLVEVLAAALSNGRDERHGSEIADRQMLLASTHLYETLMDRLSLTNPEARTSVHKIAQRMNGFLD